VAPGPLRTRVVSASHRPSRHIHGGCPPCEEPELYRCFGQPRVEDHSDKQRVRAQIEAMAKSTVQVADRHLGDRRPADTIPIGDPPRCEPRDSCSRASRSGARSAVFTRYKREREAAPLEDESVGHKQTAPRDARYFGSSETCHGPSSGVIRFGLSPARSRAGTSRSQLPEPRRRNRSYAPRRGLRAMDRPDARLLTIENRSRAKG